MADQKMTRKISKVLIANRGEIALRIQRACHALGIGTVSVASEADKRALHARKADELAIIGAPPAAESYLHIERILEAAIHHRADAIHPGYGFLSENSEFARRVRDAGLVFVGPSPESIEALGSKTKARATVIKHGVPITPGSAAGLSDEELIGAASEIGFPVIVKAAAGGGGRGMRVFFAAHEMAEQLPRARAEARKFFGSPEIYLEKYIDRPRHVEVQIVGDQFGTVLHFGTRDCSTQRRHQKLVEEAPAPFLSDFVREGLHNAAVAAGKSAGYYSAGTAEFLVSGEEFYFLEMNTRIQVEHPVTEEVTGVDLVQLQLRVAQGERLPFTQEQVVTKGHAIEFRIYGEDPARNFAPAIGTISKLESVTAPYVREECGYATGDEITVHYDAMISKVIVRGKDRDQAIGRSRVALRNYQIEGLQTTIPFHQWLLTLSSFRTHPFDIKLIEREFSALDLEQLRLANQLDRSHRPALQGIEQLDTFIHRTGNGHEISIQVIHASGGFFVARALGADLKPHPRSQWRASNCRETALRCLIDEVLTDPNH
jgi:acetyl-CoA carboxylase biotin carboxylase subunit